MNNALDIDFFERYINGLLNETEMAEFNHRIHDEPEFRQSFEQFVKLISTFKIYEKHSWLHQVLDNTHREMMKEKSVYRERKLTRTLKIHSTTIAIAASVTIIILVGSILIFNYIASLQSRENDFRWLRRKVAQIELSQRQMAATMKSNRPINSSGSYTGTGFLISKDGYVLTCYHLVQNEDSLVLRNTRYGSLKAYLVKYDLQSDLALLRIKDTLFTAPKQIPVSINDKESLLGDKVFTLGYPKYDIVYSEGVVSSLTGYEGDTTSYQISLPLNPGNSGGPLVNDAGYIVGIVNGKNITQEGSAFALKSYYLKKFLSQPIDSLSQLNLSWNKRPYYSGLNRPQIVRNLSDYIFEVKVYE